MEFSVDLAKRLNAATAKVQFVADAPRMEMKERFGLLTVAAGLRQSGLFVHLEPGDLQQLRTIAISHGMFPLLTRSTLLRPERYDNYPEAISRVFRERDAASDHQVLWICGNNDARNRVKFAPGDSGDLLAYPACCMQSERRANAFVGEAFAKAIVDKAGGDPKLVRVALRDNWKVHIEVPDEFESFISGLNIERTDATFPFALHIACDACLEAANSPTAELNRLYAAFAQELDPAVYEGFVAAASSKD